MPCCIRCEGLGVVCARCDAVYDDCICGPHLEQPTTCPDCGDDEDFCEGLADGPAPWDGDSEDAVIDDPDLWDTWNERGSD